MSTGQTAAKDGNHIETRVVVRWMSRAVGWLDELQTSIGVRASSTSGRFYALFGRDSLWSLLFSLEAARLLPADTELALWAARGARATLEALCATQGTDDNPENEEQPGKIIHEYWPVIPAYLESARWPLREGRYYGSVDATHLFLIAVGTVWEQTVDGRDFIDSIWPHALSALQWALEYGDVDGDGLVEVQPRQPQKLGLTHHVWKDSGDSLLSPDEAPLAPPIAWVELQGYAIAAFRSMAAILRERQESETLQQAVSKRISKIQHRLNLFWLPDENCPAIALTAEKKPIPMVASNMGHLLWTNALSSRRAQATANRLLQPDMLTRWGIRTVSSLSYAFDPFSYHRGSIWPFDSAVSAMACWRLGRHNAARTIGYSILDAIGHFDSPVELYSVVPNSWVFAPHIKEREALIQYKRASSVQAWSAAALLTLSAQILAEDQ